MKSPRGAVLNVLAHHSGRPVSTIHAWQDLERDLEMTPLERVLLALEIEDIEAVDLDLSELDRPRTVGDLVTFFTREVARARVALAAEVA